MQHSHYTSIRKVRFNSSYSTIVQHLCIYLWGFPASTGNSVGDQRDFGLPLKDNQQAQYNYF